MILDDLNEAQREAVTHTEGTIRVIAGAGSGKTRALTRRYAYLVNDMGILPGNILCVTFTNKAANEMRQRVHRLTGDLDTAYINTFHGFCVSVLSEESFAVQYPKSFLVLDNSDIDDMLQIVYEERSLTLRDMSFSKARDMIEIMKLFKHPDYYLDMLGLSLEALHEKYLHASGTDEIIFYGYLYQQKKCFGLDYNDLIKVTLHIFEKHESIRLKWQKRLEYIMIDEFQDIDELQYKLMEVLCAYHRNLFIVGDPDQTIYTWRGANVKFLLDFDRRFSGTKTIMMMQNYRSTPQILAVANSMIAKNRTRIKKDLIPVLPDGESVLWHHAKDAEGEAEWMALQIQTLHDAGIPYRDVTLLYRAHHLSREIEQVFQKRSVPYCIYSGTPFFNRAEVKDALSYLRMIAYRDDLSFRRIANVPKRNLGKRRMAFLQSRAADKGCTLFDALSDSLGDEIFKGTKAADFVRFVESYAGQWENRPVSELLSELLDRSRYEEMLRTEGSQERLDNLAELKQSVYDFETSCGEEATLEHYLSHVALFTNSDAEDKGDKVKLMTVHASKGLEFPYVFLCGMNDGFFPSRKVVTLPGMEEERRLAFVAVTRAQKRLFLSEAEGRGIDGSPRYPSRFLLEVDPPLLEHTQPLRDSLIRDARDYFTISEQYLPTGESEGHFAVGQRVKHEIMGPGTVVDVDLDRSAHIIQFDAAATPRAISFRARLVALPDG